MAIDFSQLPGGYRPKSSHLRATDAVSAIGAFAAGRLLAGQIWTGTAANGWFPAWLVWGRLKVIAAMASIAAAWQLSTYFLPFAPAQRGTLDQPLNCLDGSWIGPGSAAFFSFPTA